MEGRVGVLLGVDDPHEHVDDAHQSIDLLAVGELGRVVVGEIEQDQADPGARLQESVVAVAQTAGDQPRQGGHGGIASLGIRLHRPEHDAVQVAAHGAQHTRPGRLVGNGAYRLRDWQPQASLTLERNPHYWDVAAVRLGYGGSLHRLAAPAGVVAGVCVRAQDVVLPTGAERPSGEVRALAGV